MHRLQVRFPKRQRKAIFVDVQEVLVGSDEQRDQSLRSLRKNLPIISFVLWNQTPGQEPEGATWLPDHEAAASDPEAFIRLHRLAVEQARGSGRVLAQRAGKWSVVVNPPAPPLAEQELDALSALPCSRRAHPAYAAPVPALETVQFSITSHRGCFGGCAFCALYAHQGRTVQSRSVANIVQEARELAAHPDFRGVILDVGGPTANSYGLGCREGRDREGCPRPSCLWPQVCSRLETSHARQLAMLRRVAQVPGVKRVFVASGVRFDLALQDGEYVRELARHYVGGHLKIAPEHFAAGVLRLMRKPAAKCYLDFNRAFRKHSEEVRKEQYVVPYLMSGHPGCRLADMEETTAFMRAHGIRVEQVQSFTPIPMTDATCMWHTGRDPGSGKPVYVARDPQERAAQLALLQQAGYGKGGSVPRKTTSKQRRTGPRSKNL